MQSILESGTVDLVRLALDASTMRQQAIAHNIANASTPGYQRMGVNFDAHMAAVASTAPRGANPPSLGAFRPVFEQLGGEPVSLDTEMAALSENTLHHQALLKALSKHLALLGTAINEGKR